VFALIVSSKYWKCYEVFEINVIYSVVLRFIQFNFTEKSPPKVNAKNKNKNHQPL